MNFTVLRIQIVHFMLKRGKYRSFICCIKFQLRITFPKWSLAKTQGSFLFLINKFEHS